MQSKMGQWLGRIGLTTTIERRRWALWVMVACAAILFVAQGLISSRQKSASFDEQYHLTAGYTYLRTGDFRLATTHPPLLGLLAATGLLGLDGITLPLEDPSWAAGDRFKFSDVFLWETNERSVQMLEAARRPLVALGILLVIVTFLWARQMLGVPAAILATVLVAFEPNLVSNARIIATDFGLSVLLFFAMWLTWRWLRSPTWPNAAWMGVMAGLAMAAKYTGLMYWPIALMVILVYPMTTPQFGYRRRLMGLVVAGFAAYFVLWAVYRFSLAPIHVGNIFVPVPAGFYWQEIWDTFWNISTGEEGKLGFLLGNVFATPPWQYFPFALAVKTPIALLLLVGGGVYAMATQRRVRELCVLWLPALFYLALGMTGVLAIGFRHVLPALPFLVLLAANAANLSFGAERRRRTAQYVLGAAALWLIVSSVRVFPNQEAYFNELAGRWQNWSQLLVDSNLDWGQDLPALRTTMQDLGIDSVNLAYFGKGVPEKYGVRYSPLPSYLRFMEGYEVDAYNPYTPEPGWYAISATSLRLGTMLPGTTELYAAFRDLEPAARAGYSIYLYYLDYPPDKETKRTVVSGIPVAQLSADQLGVTPDVRVQAKWTRSSEASDIVPFRDSESALAELDDAPGVNTILMDADLGGVFALDGYTIATSEVHAGDDVALQLYWQRGQQPMPEPAPTRARPISAFIHLVGPDSADTYAQYDGWDTALRGLEPGDLVIQNAVITLPSDLSPGDYRLIVGLYSPQSGQRLEAVGAPDVGGAVTLGFISVQ